MSEFGQLTEVIFKDSDYQTLKVVGGVVQRQRGNLNENQETQNIERCQRHGFMGKDFPLNMITWFYP